MGFLSRNKSTRTKDSTVNGSEAVSVEGSKSGVPYGGSSDVYRSSTGTTGADTLSRPSGVMTMDSSTMSRTEQIDDSTRVSKSPWFTSRSVKVFKKPPPAEQAAYSGPPRYDWVDIETSAAIKIQASYRRKRVLDAMEESGATTAAARNMARRRQAAREATVNPAQDFINLFNCCGVDLGLGGGHKEQYTDISRELETVRYSATRKEQAEREEMLRKKYGRRPPRESLVENVEVVQ